MSIPAMLLQHFIMNHQYTKNKTKEIILKMKKFFIYLLTLLLILQTTSSVTYARSDSVSYTTRTYLEDGYYIVTTLTTNSPRSSISTYASTYSKTASRTTNVYNSSNQILWSVKVIGTFTYGNGSAQCTKADVDVKSYNSYWKLSNVSAARSGATAYASATGKKIINGIVMQTINRSISITCSPTGELS